MKLTKQAIHDFQEAYYKDFGEHITEDQAAELGTRLIRLMAVVHRPLHQESPNNNPEKL